MGRRIRAAVLAALTIGIAAGCGDGAETPSAGGAASASPSTTPVAPGPPWYDDVAPATAATKVGPTGTSCELPITFDLPAKWKAKPVVFNPDFAELIQVGGSTMSCEIDAKPAGNIGFMRVWVVDRGAVIGARKGLEEFVAKYGKLTDVQYRDTKAGPLIATEVTFMEESELTGETKRGRALVVATRFGTMLLTLSGTDTEEFEAMFPAFQLAKQTVSVTR
ncbi:lipoprotein [Plantactinospora solaniradicis]|uniref:Lipoprotein n=1 Tax=Plantactinospora solaniradicis TaxID=1723736 RepID=A0ABW1KEN9_9ACTN